MNGIQFDASDYFAMEPNGPVQQVPLFFTPGEVRGRQDETNLDGRFVFEAGSWPWVPNVPANPFTFPLDMYGTKDVQFVDQLNYPPPTLGRTFNQVEPLIYPDKYLHQIIEWR